MLTFSPTHKYRNHANEVNLPIPEVPVLFMKPSTALSDPFPAPTVLPKAFAKDDSADYESELAVVLGKDCKNVSEAEAMDYVLGSVGSFPSPDLGLH
jgi:2-keto-4-pentenoate hydratase/2-oxohepta-3-ene-1,7-dioic acid hydratase in catechol pathway